MNNLQHSLSLEFVNHASIMISHDAVKLITDPWFTGSAFNMGWDLLVPTEEKYLSFNGVTHIWFSHEHPDHFSPADLKRIPEEARPNITVLYQETMDKKVIDFCRKLGFLLVELPVAKPYALSNSFSITCAPYTGGDSWAYFNVDGTGILNVNDCILGSLEDCTQILPYLGKVDVLCTQFGYANWVGNPEDVEDRRLAAVEKLQRIKVQCTVFNPKVVLPFASFVRFSHQENAYLMDFQNTVGVAHDFILHQTMAQPLVMFPSDMVFLPLAETHVSAQALQKYEQVYKAASTAVLNTSPVVPQDELQKMAVVFAETLLRKNPTARPLIQKLRPKIYLWDLQKAFVFKGLAGLQTINEHEEDCDIKLSSDSLHYFFRFEWGGDTLNVNGRFRKTKNGDIYRFNLFTRIRSLNNRGEVFHYQPPSLFSKAIFRLKRVFAA